MTEFFDTYNGLSAIAQNVLDEIRVEENKFIIGYFGSLEAAVKNAPYYVLEYDPIELIEIGSNEYRAEQKMRIRFKTEEELNGLSGISEDE